MNIYSLLRLPLILIGLVAALVISLANRSPVILSLDPFSSTSPLLSIEMPLYVLLFGFLLMGVLVGGMAAWAGQVGWRKKARRGARDVRHLAKNLARHQAEAEKAATEPTSDEDGAKSLTTT